MKKLAYFFVFCLITFAIGSCESDSRIVTTDDYAAMQKGGPEATAKCECFGPETAWAFGPRYVTQGNWATYVPYTHIVQGSTCVRIMAGQYMDIGEVCFIWRGVNEVEIIINLYGNWCLNSDEAIKIQAYNVAPTVTPKPGLFTTYKDTPAFESCGTDCRKFSLGIFPKANFYGVHLDVDCCD